MSPILLHPPFKHPKKDAFLSRARVGASLTLALLQAAWFIGYVIQIKSGTPLNAPASLLGLFGLALLTFKIQPITDLSLGLTEIRGGLPYAPAPLEWLRRLLMTVVAPMVLLVIAFMNMTESWVVLVSCLGIFLLESFNTLGGFQGWRHPRVSPPVLKSILLGQSLEPRRLLGSAGEACDPRDLEVSILAMARSAIDREDRRLLEECLDILEDRIKLGGRMAGQLMEKWSGLSAILKADIERLLSDAAAAPYEAIALMSVGVGHPRRLALGLFVATAALETDEPESAVKALRLLHSRDAMSSTARCVVNWLMLHAAKTIGDSTLERDCLSALRTFDLAREAATIDVAQVRDREDAYSRWICLARDGLRSLAAQFSTPPAGSN